MGPVAASAWEPGAPGAPQQPFARYRKLLYSYQRARAAGWTDDDFLSLVHDCDAAVAAVDGRGFRPTPFARSEALSDALGFSRTGGVWVKDETANVAGSHKGRHLMGVLLHLELVERLGLAPSPRPKLAIASCGNAAVAAAVIAAAGSWQLEVFVPGGAEPAVVARLEHLGAEVTVCPRPPGTAGDPTYESLKRAIAGGALPFTCQGNLNGLAIEGGETLGYEMVSGLLASAIELDHLVVQVGGGALASSCAQAFTEAVGAKALARLPRFHTVQTMCAHPLERAHRLVREGLLSPATQADAAPDDIDRALREAAAHRSIYMRPWPTEPKSIATGILDDETYDWLAVVGAMLRTGGQTTVVSEDLLGRARDLARAAGFRAGPTGGAGLAGLVALRSQGAVGPHERAAVIFTSAHG
jgi:threonine synthase